MLTDRLPLYILAVYASFLYVPLACVWRLGLPRLAEVTLAGITGMFFYAPFDVVGIKFLWWTWHDSDTVVAERLLGVPVSSTMWVGVYTCMFALLFNVFLPPSHDDSLPKALPSLSALKGIASSSQPVPLVTMASMCRACSASFLSVPLMMLHMMVVQCLLGGLVVPPPPPPTKAMLGFIFVVYGSLCVSSLADAAIDPQRQEKAASRNVLRTAGTSGSASHWLITIVVLHYGMLLGVAWMGDPTTHVSTGTHQTWGPCHVESVDYAGEKCDKFVCDVLRVQDSFSVHCGSSSGGGSANQLIQPTKDVELEWYSICGLPKTDEWKRVSVAYSVSGLLVFLLLIGVQGDLATRKNKKEEKQY